MPPEHLIEATYTDVLALPSVWRMIHALVFENPRCFRYKRHAHPQNPIHLASQYRSLHRECEWEVPMLQKTVDL